ncbi:MAG TPA: MASE1 domain-containing protein [Xanthomonadaceae bacterium]|nr:MASE1 domain-containing protein [Xanthomonadaceae bacterium]
MNSISAGDRNPLVLIAKTFAVGVLVALFCWISIRFTRQPGSTPTLWIASGILTGILLTSHRRLWPGYVLAALAGNVIVRVVIGDAWHAALGLAFASIIDSVPVAVALARWVGDVTDPARLKLAARVALAARWHRARCPHCSPRRCWLPTARCDSDWHTRRGSRRIPLAW